MSNSESGNLRNKFNISVNENKAKATMMQQPVSIAGYELSRDSSMKRSYCNGDTVCMTLNKSRIVIELLAELAIGTLFTAEEHQILEEARQSTRPATLYIEQCNGFKPAL